MLDFNVEERNRGGNFYADVVVGTVRRSQLTVIGQSFPLVAVIIIKRQPWESIVISLQKAGETVNSSW